MDSAPPLQIIRGGPADHLRPTMRMRDVVAITVGIVIGAGIFRAPTLVAGVAGSADILLLAWTAGGVLSIIGALCYAELASARPSAGGDYHYIFQAFGHRPAFLYAWARLVVIQTGSIALLAFVFGDYASQIFSLGSFSSAIYAAIVVVAITAANWSGIHFGTRVQNLLTVAEVAGLATVIVAGLLLAPAASNNVAHEAEASFGLMMVFVLLTFGGWNEAVYLSAELRDGRRRMGRAMVLSLILITLLYLLANLAYLRTLSLGGMAGSEAVAADVMNRATGPGGAVIISILIAVAALSSANATALTGARTNYSLGCDFHALRWLGVWNDRRSTPANALIAQGAIALLLVLGGALSRDGFQTAVEYSAPVFWFFFLLVGISLFVLRWRFPNVERPFRVPLYPLLPAIFCLTCAFLFYSSLAYTGIGAIVGVGAVALGGVFLPFLRPAPQQEMT